MISWVEDVKGTIHEKQAAGTSELKKDLSFIYSEVYEVCMPNSFVPLQTAPFNTARKNRK